MDARQLSIAGLLLALALPMAAQDQAEAPMRAAPAEVVDTGGLTAAVSDIRARYEQAYAEAGRPAIAIFWNRQFDDQLAQWYATSPVSTPGHGGSGESGQEAGREDGHTIWEERIDTASRFEDGPAPGELASLEFSAGLRRTLLASGTELVERDALIRLAQRQVPEPAGGPAVSDYQEIEKEALIGSADLVAEIFFASPPDGAGSFPVMVSVREVATGRVVSVFRSREDVLPVARTQARWIPGEVGYTHVEVPLEETRALAAEEGLLPGSAGYFGWLISLQLMEALTENWTR